MSFATIAIDPPWPERGGGGKGAQAQYDVVAVPDLPRVILSAPVWDPADDAHLYMWATNTHLMEAGWLMRALGFRYVTCITWPKRTIGIGQYFRGQTEHIVFGVRGNGYAVRTADKSLTTLLGSGQLRLGETAPVPKKYRHSEKPSSAYDLIEARSRGPFLELFARAPRSGWTVWGNEV
jgi:N6-adenosine-specific RNA methylase IME4